MSTASYGEVAWSSGQDMKWCEPATQREANWLGLYSEELYMDHIELP